MKKRKLFYAYVCVLSIIIIFVACTKNDSSLAYQDNSDDIRANSNDSIINDLRIANETIVKLVAANLDEKIYVINDISLSMIANSELVGLITKPNKEDNDKNREETIKEEIFSNIYRSKYISDIAFIKDQTYSVSCNPKYQESDFLNGFLKSEVYNKVIQGKGIPIYVVGLFNDEQIYCLRLVCNWTESESNEFAVMIIELDKNELIKDIPFLDNQNNIKSALIDNTGQVLFDKGINYDVNNTNKGIDFDVNNTNIDASSTIINEENKKVITANAKCYNGWIYILEQEID